MADAKDTDLFGGPAPTTRDRRGRRRHIPKKQERAAVETLAGYGVSHDEIGLIIGIAPKTLRERYRDELDGGTALANAKVAQNLFAKATGNGREAVTAAMFWLRCRAGWSEYAAPPAPPSRDRTEVPLGKKDAAQLAAETADEGTSWRGLLN